MRGLLPPTPSGTPRGARLVRSPGEAGQRQGRFLGTLTVGRVLWARKLSSLDRGNQQCEDLTGRQRFANMAISGHVSRVLFILSFLVLAMGDSQPKRRSVLTTTFEMQQSGTIRNLRGISMPTRACLILFDFNIICMRIVHGTLWHCGSSIGYSKGAGAPYLERTLIRTHSSLADVEGISFHLEANTVPDMKLEKHKHRFYDGILSLGLSEREHPHVFVNSGCTARRFGGFAVGDTGYIATTTDSGNSWTPVPSGETLDFYATR
eukprot:1192932-Prorocentrum_minimum.AAC.2